MNIFVSKSFSMALKEYMQCGAGDGSADKARAADA